MRVFYLSPRIQRSYRIERNVLCPNVTIYGAPWWPDCKRARQLASSIGEGAAVLLAVRQYLQKLGEEPTKDAAA
jgi:hypothetical protein